MKFCSDRSVGKEVIGVPAKFERDSTVESRKKKTEKQIDFLYAWYELLHGHLDLLGTDSIELRPLPLLQEGK